MNQALEKLLKVSRDAHIPMPLDLSLIHISYGKGQGHRMSL